MSEHYVTLAEVKDLIAERQEGKELRDFQKAALEHAQTVCPLTSESAKNLVEELSKFSDEGVTEGIAVKIADILPREPVDIRAILSKERVTLDGATIDEILEIVLRYI